MQAAGQWKLIERDLGADWDEARFLFSVEDPGSIGDAAAVLAPLGPGRAGGELRFQIRREGGGPDKVRNLVGRLDRKRIWGTLTLVESRAEPRAATAVESEKALGLVESWDEALSHLPPGWRDLLCELELDSTDYLPRAALLGAPLNPTRNPEQIALRFRVTSGVGYGTSPGMARRCLERIAGDGITGRASVLNVLSDTGNEATLGPVWRIAGQSV
ncbi:MAG: hypothetical protein H0W35_00945 [Actinobacteria bacterium]|nr:hypothetical protein [Actinomycetota bacterium]MBA3565535.1 hypothetical protein [Actinomycetota bacterium]